MVWSHTLVPDCDPQRPPPEVHTPSPRHRTRGGAFTKLDGTRVFTKDEWECRRAEIHELAESSVYGEKPAPPDSVTGTVSSSDIAMNVTDQGRSTGFSASVDLPSGPGPFPAVIVYGGFGADTDTVKAAGAAVIDYGREPHHRRRRAVGRQRPPGGRDRRHGCSRYGKGAFVAGAFDQRVALTMPIESGTGGAPVFRGIAREDGSQPLDGAYGEQPWLGDAFGSHTGDPSTLPVDTHEIVGMIEPRGLLIMENPHVEWLGARSGSVAALGGAEVCTALGAEEDMMREPVRRGPACPGPQSRGAVENASRALSGRR